MAKSDKKDIGKGIRALLSNIEKEKSPKQKSKDLIPSQYHSLELALDQIVPNPFQPRTDFDEELIMELVESIKTFGVIQPITVRRLSSKKYQIITGERRWRASKIARLKAIPSYIREADDQGMLEMALLENIQRSDLNALEVALSYQRLIDECKLTHEDLSSRLGIKRSSISNYIRILKLPPEVQKAVKNELISMGHAKVIAGLKKYEEQLQILDEIIRGELSVRAAEIITKNRSGKRSQVLSNTIVKLPEIVLIEDRLGEKIGGKVNITRSTKGSGSIKISFKNDNDLNAIVDSILE